MSQKPTRVLIWPNTAEGLAECWDYIRWSNGLSPYTTPAPPTGWLAGQSWMNPAEPEFDIYEQPFCPMCEYRPDFDEPSGGAAKRPNAVIHDNVIRPEPEEEA